MLLIDVKIALKSLGATRVRTALTILGIIIGVASVTAVLVLGEGAKQTVRNQVKQLGDNMITIRSGKATRDANGNLVDYNLFAALGSSTISEHDLTTVQQTPGIKVASPIMAVTGTVKSGGNEAPIKNAAILATNTDSEEVLGFKVHAGDFLDDNINRDTVVLGKELAIELLGSDNAIGQKIQLRGKEFTVLGILNRYNTPVSLSSMYDYNHAAFITMDAGKEFNQGIAHIQQINARSESAKNLQPTIDAVQAILLKNHGGEEDFAVLRPEEMLTITNNVLRVIIQFSSAIASISLFVGGIGIMNIMLVSVTERTREIGIRKAVGATNSQIMRQFLIEALVMSVTGGVIGIGVAYGLGLVIGSFFGVVPVLTPAIFFAAVGIASVVGVIFGVMPAMKAARKDPIEALRFFQ